MQWVLCWEDLEVTGPTATWVRETLQNTYSTDYLRKQSAGLFRLKKVDTAEKKGVTIYGNCGQCYPNAPIHSTDKCKYGPATGKSASFLSRRYEHADSLGHDLADPDVVTTLHDMGWFDGDPAAATAEAWNITSQHGTHEKEDVHHLAPPASPPQETATMPPQVTPSMTPPAAPPKNAIIHEATRAGVGIILLVAALACTDVITDTKTMAMAILIGFGFPAVLFFTLVEPAGAPMIHTIKLAPAMYGSRFSPQEWRSMLAHHNEWHSALVQHNTLHATANNVDPTVYVLLTVCALAVVTMLMIQRGRATPERRAPTAAALNTELHAMSTFRRQMTTYLNREPTATELEGEQRRLAYQVYVQEHGFSPLSPEPTPPPSPTCVAPDPPDSEYSSVTPPESGDDEAADSGDEGPTITREEYDLALATINQTEAFIYDLTAARNEGVYGMTGRDENHESWSPVSDAPLSEYNPPAAPVTVAPETEEAHERSPVPGNEDAMEDEDEVATVTPRGTRYNRRSGALTLATLMCCVGEAQSTATAIRHATSVNPALHGSMSIQLTAMWALAMCAARTLNRLPFLAPLFALGWPLDDPGGPRNQL
jgi:hypothetical protein